MERSYCATVIGCLTVGLLVLGFSAMALILFEVLGASDIALMTLEGQITLRSILRLLLFVMLPTLGVAFLATAWVMWSYRKSVRSDGAERPDKA
jgi:hypothetical protein